MMRYFRAQILFMLLSFNAFSADGIKLTVMAMPDEIDFNMINGKPVWCEVVYKKKPHCETMSSNCRGVKLLKERAVEENKWLLITFPNKNPNYCNVDLYTPKSVSTPGKKVKQAVSTK